MANNIDIPNAVYDKNYIVNKPTSQKNLVEITPETVVPGKSEVIKNTEKELTSEKISHEIDKSINDGVFSGVIAKEILKQISESKNLKTGEKSMCLALLFQGMNKIGIKLSDSDNNSISLSGANGEKDELTKEIEKNLNEYIKNNSISIGDILRGLSFRTSAISSYNFEKGEKATNDKLFIDIAKRNGITINTGDLDLNKGSITITSQQEFNVYSSMIENKVNSQADKDFMMMYITQKFHNKDLKNGNFVKDFQDQKQQAKKLLNENLSLEQKAQLGLTTDDALNKTLNNVFKPELGKGDSGFGMICAVLGFLFGFSGDNGGLFKGLTYGFLGYAGGTITQPLASEASKSVVGGAGNIFGKIKHTAYENLQKNQNKTPTSEYITLDTTELKTAEVYGELIKNNNFLSQNAGFLDIFETQKDNAEIIKKFKEIGIENITTISGENIDIKTSAGVEFYKKLFAKIKKQQVDNGVGNYVQTESIDAYLKRKNKIETSTQPAITNNGNGVQTPNKGAVNETPVNNKQELKQSIEANEKIVTVGILNPSDNSFIGKDNHKYSISELNLVSPELNKKLSTTTSNYFLLLQGLSEVHKDDKKYLDMYNDCIKHINSIDLTNPQSINNYQSYINGEITKLGINSQKITNYDSGVTITIDKEVINLGDKLSILKYLKDLGALNTAGTELESDLKARLLGNISDEEMLNFSENPNIENTKIKEILGEEEYKKFVNKLIIQRADCDKYIAENKEKYINEYLKNGVSKEKAEEQFLKNDSPLIKNTFLVNYGSSYLLEKIIYKDKDFSNIGLGYQGNDKEIDLYSGLKGFGALIPANISNEAKMEIMENIAWEVLALGLGAISMGVGAYAVNAVRLTRIGKLGNLISEGTKGTRLYKGLKGATGVVFEGATFYGGYGLAPGKHYSTEGFVESIAFMGAMKLVSGFAKYKNFDINPDKSIFKQKINFTKLVTLDTAAMSTIGIASNSYDKNGEISFEPGEYTLQDIATALVFAGIFRSRLGNIGQKGGKYTTEKSGLIFKKIINGNLEIKENSITALNKAKEGYNNIKGLPKKTINNVSEKIKQKVNEVEVKTENEKIYNLGEGEKTHITIDSGNKANIIKKGENYEYEGSQDIDKKIYELGLENKSGTADLELGGEKIKTTFDADGKLTNEVEVKTRISEVLNKVILEKREKVELNKIGSLTKNETTTFNTGSEVITVKYLGDGKYDFDSKNIKEDLDLHEYNFSKFNNPNVPVLDYSLLKPSRQIKISDFEFKSEYLKLFKEQKEAFLNSDAKEIDKGFEQYLNSLNRDVPETIDGIEIKLLGKDRFEIITPDGKKDGTYKELKSDFDKISLIKKHEIVEDNLVSMVEIANEKRINKPFEVDGHKVEITKNGENNEMKIINKKTNVVLNAEEMDIFIRNHKSELGIYKYIPKKEIDKAVDSKMEHIIKSLKQKGINTLGDLKKELDSIGTKDNPLSFKNSLLTPLTTISQTIDLFRRKLSWTEIINLVLVGNKNIKLNSLQGAIITTGNIVVGYSVMATGTGGQEKTDLLKSIAFNNYIGSSYDLLIAGINRFNQK